MDNELDVLEERIKRLEDLVLGQDKSRNDDIELLDVLLSVSNKLASVASKNEKVSGVLKKAEEINKYCDPLYGETDVLVPECVKYQLVVTEEEKIKEAVSQFEKLENLKPVLDSQVFQDIPKLENQLNKVSTVQGSQDCQMEAIATDTYAMLQHYNDIVNGLSRNLAAIESAVSNLELSKS